MPHPIPKDLLAAYDCAFQQKFGEPAPLQPGKDGKLAQALLARYPLEKLRDWLAVFFTLDDPWIAKSGYGFGIFYQSIGKCITAKHAKVAALPAWQRKNLEM